MILTLFGGCISTTKVTINAVDLNGKPVDGANVMINGKNIGLTPNASTKTSNFMGTDVEITVSKAGYYTARTEANKDLVVGNVILGFCINPFALLWVFGPKKNQNVVITPEK
jgi:hypothetical protein